VVVNESNALARRWRRTLRALDSGISVAYLRSELGKYPIDVVAEALDLICAAAEQAEEGAREVLVGLVDLLAERAMVPLVDALRSEASAAALLSLGRLVRRPSVSASAPPPPPSKARVPDYTGGRTLSLGERKALARRPTRKSLEKLLADPHPAVIRALLGNPKLVEDDVVRLAARRPALPEVLTEVARAARWAHRVRVRMALLLNPDMPVELATPFLLLLTGPELKQVVEAPYLALTLRSAARDLLLRRGKARAHDGGGGVH